MPLDERTAQKKEAERKGRRAAAERARRARVKAAREATVERKRQEDVVAAIRTLSAEYREQAEAALKANRGGVPPSSSVTPRTLAGREAKIQALTGRDRMGQDAAFYGKHPEQYAALGQRIGATAGEPAAPPPSAVASPGSTLTLAAKTSYGTYNLVRGLFPALELPARRSLRDKLKRLAPQAVLVRVSDKDGDVVYVFVSLRQILVYEIEQYTAIQTMERKELVTHRPCITLRT